MKIGDVVKFNDRVPYKGYGDQQKHTIAQVLEVSKENISQFKLSLGVKNLVNKAKKPVVLVVFEDHKKSHSPIPARFVSIAK